MDYYTNISVRGNNILFRGIVKNKRVSYTIPYQPTFYIPTNQQSQYKTLYGENLIPYKFDSIKDANNYRRKYKDVDNFKIYGQENISYQFIADNFKQDIEWDISHIKIAFLDIEVGSDNGFPEPEKAESEITAITIRYLNEDDIHVFGCGDYTPHESNIKYYKCSSEIDLCRKFIRFWSSDYPDVYSGWNTEFFDIPYLVNRFNKILGVQETKALSPWGVINNATGRKDDDKLKYNITGISGLDYLELYKNYAKNGKSQSSYKLDNIAFVELGESKLSYEEYGNLNELYKNNFQKYIEYNVKDVYLIMRFEEKMKLIELALTLAYEMKTNYSDVFAQTRMWNSLTYSYLLDHNIIVPFHSFETEDSSFEGAYVKPPIPGMYEYVASFDLNSLYPHLMMQYNISPECLIEPKDYTETMHEIIRHGIDVDKVLEKQIPVELMERLKNEHATVTPNGQFFRTDIQGFLPKILSDKYDNRTRYKKIAKDAQKKYEEETDPNERISLMKTISRYSNLEQAQKLGLNACYGVMGTKYFRFYDIRLASAITTAGQLSIRWVDKHITSYLTNTIKKQHNYVVYCDTDSVYLTLEPLVSKVCKDKTNIRSIINFMDRVCDEKLQPIINNCYDELATYMSAYAQKMKMKRECLADKCVMISKKRYILNVYNNEGVEYKEPKLKVMGLEMVKSSTPLVVRDKMKEIIKLIVTKNEEEVQHYIETFRQEFKKYPPEEVSFPRGVNGLGKYTDNNNLYRSKTPIHVRGALIYNRLLEQLKIKNTYEYIKEGDKLLFCYLKTPNPTRENVISFPNQLPKEFNLNDYVDYNMQFEKTFLAPIQIILDALEWKAEKVNTLESFFI